MKNCFQKNNNIWSCRSWSFRLFEETLTKIWILGCGLGHVEIHHVMNVMNLCDFWKLRICKRLSRKVSHRTMVAMFGLTWRNLHLRILLTCNTWLRGIIKESNSYKSKLNVNGSHLLLNDTKMIRWLLAFYYRKNTMIQFGCLS